MKIGICASVFSLAIAAFAADCWWNGKNTDSVMDASKWSGKVLPTAGDRALINDGETYPMTVSTGDTLTCNHFTLGVSKAAQENSMTMNGGSVSAAGDMSVAFYAGCSATVTVNGGEVTASNIRIGQDKKAVGSFYLNGGTVTLSGLLNVAQAAETEGLFRMTGGVLNLGGDFNVNYDLAAKGRFEMTGGTINLASGKAFSVPRYGHATGMMSGADAVINFNGANFYLDSTRNWNKLTEGHGEFTLADGATLNGSGFVELDGPDSTFTCNGGVIVCGRTGNYFTAQGTVYVGNGGITIDTNGYDVNANKPFLAAEGATSGGLVKKGAGKLTLKAGNTYLAGPVDIQAGTVYAPGPSALPGYATCEFKLAAGATLELGGAWSPAQITAIKALPTVLGTVTQTSLKIDEDTVWTDNLTAQDVTDGKIANPMTGSAVLTLTGNNDFGGEFRINSGVLAADFGQGLAATDHLTIGEDDGFNKYTPALFAPLSGLVTCNIGTAAGEISFGSNTEAGFAGVVPTTVKLFNDETRVLSGSAEVPRKLVFNSGTATNDVHFLNPIALTSGNTGIDVTVLAGEAYLDGTVNYLDNGTPATSGTFAKKGSGTLHMPSSSTLGTVYSQGGTLVYPAGSTVKLSQFTSTSADAVTDFGANSTFEAKNFNNTKGTVVFNEGSRITTGGSASSFGNMCLTIFSNTTWKVTASDVVVMSQDGSTAEGGVLIKGGTFENTGTGWMQAQDGGTFIFDGCEATIKPAFIAGRTSVTTHPTSKTIIRNGAQMNMASLVTMHGDLEIDGEDTVVKTTGLHLGESDTAASASGPGTVLIRNGRVEVSGDVRIAYRSGSVGLLRIEGGTLWASSGKSFAVGSAGNGTFEVAGGLVDGSEAAGVAILPTWQTEDATYKKTPGGLLRLLGGEVKARKIYGNVTRGKADVDFDGGKATFVNPSETTIFSGVSSRRMGVNGGEIDVGTADLRMSGAFEALTNQEAVAVSGADLNAAKSFAKSGSGTLTMVGANTYSCGTAVNAGKLALASGASLPSDQFVRVDAGAELNLGGANQTVSALLGTGTVKTGSLTVTEAIYPAGVGTVGTLTLTDVAPSGKVVIDVAADGATCDKLVVNGTLDASKLEFEVADVSTLDKVKTLRVLEATAINGRPTISNLPNNFTLSTSQTAITIARAGMIFYVR